MQLRFTFIAITLGLALVTGVSTAAVTPPTPSIDIASSHRPAPTGNISPPGERDDKIVPMTRIPAPSKRSKVADAAGQLPSRGVARLTMSAPPEHMIHDEEMQRRAPDASEKKRKHNQRAGAAGVHTFQRLTLPHGLIVANWTQSEPTMLNFVSALLTYFEQASTITDKACKALDLADMSLSVLECYRFAMATTEVMVKYSVMQNLWQKWEHQAAARVHLNVSDTAAGGKAFEGVWGVTSV